MNPPLRAGDRASSVPFRFLDEVWQDARFALRGLRRSLGFATMAVLVLALAIGANTAIFALADAVLLRPLGIAEPDRLVRVFGKNTAEPDTYRSFSYPNYVDLRDGASVFEEIAAFTPSLVGLDRGDGTMRREFAQLVSANYFSTLGAEPAIGRAFTVEEEKPNAAIRAVVVSHSFWSRGGADPSLLGKTILINGEEYTVVGVAPEGFGGVSALLTTNLWLPLGVYGTSVGQFMASAGGDLATRDRHELMVIGRLRRGSTAEQALPQLEALASRMAADSPEVNRDYTFAVAPQPRLGLSSRPSKDTAIVAASAFMMGMAGIVLLVACLNLANMFLARGAARRTEIAIRQSLGGGRGRILRQLLTEGFLVSLGGGALGLLLGTWAARWVVASIVPVLPFSSFALRIGIDSRVVLATLAFCALSTILFGLGPSLALMRSAVLDDLKDGTTRLAGVARRRRPTAPRGSKKGRRPKLTLVPRNTLVVAQIALSLALVSAAGLFLRSAQRASSYQPEFAVDGRLLIEMDAGLASLDETRGRELYRQVLERLRAQPGVESVALASNVPFSSISEGESVRMSDAAEEDAIDAEYYVTTAGYFDTMGLALLRGRDFSEAESDDARPVVIVDEPLARRLRPDGDVVGRTLLVETSREADRQQVSEIIGVVPGVRRALFDREPRSTVYLPFGRSYRPHMIAHVLIDRGGASSGRFGAGDGEAAAAAVLERAGREIRAIDARLPILSMKTLDTHLEQGMERWMVRTGASVFAALGGVAVLLALVGVYGVKAYLVSRRTREIGIRMALGAEPHDILSWMLHDGMVSTATGIAIGILLALGIGRVLSSALYGVGGVDLLTFVAAPALLAGAALLAAYLPSRRATRLAPSVALRQD